MNRITLVEQTLGKIYRKLNKGVTANEIALLLDLDRSNVSRDLNELVKSGKCLKKKTRPVLFYPVEESASLSESHRNDSHQDKRQQQPTFLDRFAEMNPSLIKQVELGKSAILYPSYLMHMLLLGETGVGKSMFAELLYDYGVESGVFEKDAPFIQFNCADYAHNPQLLMGQLFGSKKGAYTGAEEDRIGLLKQADQGILFLDEIHRLPIEGQEMLFTYMDRGTFKPLGEAEVETSVKALLIGATTEERESLLSTFTRRIPITIDLPNLKSRSIEERFQLFDLFTQAEVNKLGMTIKMSINSIKSFLSYNCQHNIGQLKMDIRIVFAKAYAQYLTGQKDQLLIATKDLPSHIQDGLFASAEHRKFWSFLDNNTERFLDYQPIRDDEQSEASFSIYKEIKNMFTILESRDLSFSDIQKEMELDLDEYVNQHAHAMKSVGDYDSLVSMIPEELLGSIEGMIRYGESLLETPLSQKVHQALAIHLFNMLERLTNHHQLNYDQDYQLASEYPELYAISQKCIAFLEQELELKIPPEEANYLVLFFCYDDLNQQKQSENVQVIVIAHGSQTATALSDTANKLLRTDTVVGINARLDEKPQVVYELLAQYIHDHQITQDVLLLVDMGSLMTFADELAKDYHLNAKAIPLVSTMHVIEAARKSMLGYSLSEVYDETIGVNNYLGSILQLYNGPTEESEESSNTTHQQKPLAVLSICMTGEGTALTIKNMLENKLSLKAKKIKIIPMNLVGSDTVQSRIRKVQETYRVILIVSTFHIETPIPNFDLYHLMNQADTSELQRIVNEELTYSNMASTIKEHYDFPQIDEVIDLIFVFNEQVEVMLNTRFNSSELIGLSFHLIGMLIKNKRGEEIPAFVDVNGIVEANLKFANRIQQLFLKTFAAYFSELDNNQLDYVAYSYLSIRQ